MSADPEKHVEMFSTAWRELNPTNDVKRPDWFDAVATREFSVVSWGISTPEIIDDFPYLEGRHFAIQKLGRVWDEIRRLAQSNENLTIGALATGAKVSVRDLLEWVMRGSDLGLSRFSATDYAEEILRSYYISTISDAAKSAMVAGSHDDIRALAEASEKARSDLAKITGTAKRPRMIGAIASDMYDLMTERMSSGQHGGATTGLHDLDEMIGGLKPGGLYIVAGRPGMGKSVLAGTIALQSAKAGTGVYFGSLELMEEMQTARFLSDEACEIGKPPIPYEDILRSTLSVRDQERIYAAKEAVRDYPLIMSDRTNITVSEIRGMVKDADRELKRAGSAVQVVVIDYLKFIKASDRYSGQRVNEVGEITAALKGMAKDMGIAVILVCQLNRQNEQREDKRPQLSDLRESGDIEQDADVVMFVYRDAYYAQFESDIPKRDERLLQSRNIMEIIIAKNRHGKTDTIKAWCDVSTSSVRDLEWKR